MANILVVHGSPRPNGNSKMLADAFMEGAREAGNSVEYVDVGRMSIAGCKACEYCFKHEGACVQQDDMQPLYEKLHWADMLVYDFPLYFYTYPAQIKAFMDRMFCGMVKPFGIKRVALLLCFEDKDASTANGLIQSFRIACNYCKQEIVGEVVVNNVYEVGAIEGNPGLEQARALGAGLS
ncbi:MAG: flavodoxin family protein [Coriobacteriia bacterium]|nr:flavodoxin family protein [Coriobacteriia bacterium]